MVFHWVAKEKRDIFAISVVKSCFFRARGDRRGSRLPQEPHDGADLPRRIDFLPDMPALPTQRKGKGAAGQQLAVEAAAGPGGGAEGVVHDG